jgi:uracil-DNA glycosylase family 4
MTKEEEVKQFLAGWHDCTKCPLATPNRKGIALGEGDPNSKIVFIGEYPKTQVEESEGKTLTPAESDLFFQALEFYGTSPKDIFFIPVLGCRPTDTLGTTSKPKKANLDACRERVEGLLDIIDPFVVVLIGQHAFNTFGKSAYNKLSYAKLTNDPRPIEMVTTGRSGAEVRRSAIVIRPFDWILAKDQGKPDGPAFTMLASLQIAFKVLDNHTKMLLAKETPVRNTVIDL